MKKIALLLLFVTSVCHAQDTIYTLKHDTLVCKIQYIDKQQHAIKYKQFEGIIMFTISLYDVYAYKINDGELQIVKNNITSFDMYQTPPGEHLEIAQMYYTTGRCLFLAGALIVASPYLFDIGDASTEKTLLYVGAAFSTVALVCNFAGDHHLKKAGVKLRFKFLK